ncbi:hypothetical protein SAMN05444170_3932 [Bradyrhizobium erythrophlei]|jgi:hypothetical protein|uniref:Uncharacterized protein n=1 Tax=Bradyrhizobium erythrophlei TaxID=1437360 RepID=A0A1M7U808_9BRAD|nr:hypothetical protein SAMN05444170_3932 [Bradyrhizobium erythrophlei]
MVTAKSFTNPSFWKTSLIVLVCKNFSFKEHQGPRDKALGLSDVKAMFLEMKGVIG